MFVLNWTTKHVLHSTSVLLTAVCIESKLTEKKALEVSVSRLVTRNFCNKFYLQFG